MKLPLPEASVRLQELLWTNDVVLGSRSLGRRKVLDGCGCRYIATMDPAIDEKAIRGTTAEETCLAVARGKADELERRLKGKDVLLLCADQVAVCDGEMREKPESADEAKRFIKDYSAGKEVVTYTALVLIDCKDGRSVEGVHKAATWFDPIPEDIINNIIANSNCLVYRCAGSFCIDDVMGPFVKSIEGGSDSVMGLPLGLLQELLEKIR
ncbi:hypothetical protein FOL47_001689 [Perkinsus chesapeaki]|uniref:Maf-like protein n=1 Tax=Perkinsus chesapeaki TaxID=330153 RepID=A0A7J6MHN0_PERCH|nr:hypothetical protein FOL47_001689 [Perkinsus chesapeaki]